MNPSSDWTPYFETYISFQGFIDKKEFLEILKTHAT